MNAGELLCQFQPVAHARAVIVIFSFVLQGLHMLHVLRGKMYTRTYPFSNMPCFIQKLIIIYPDRS